MTEHDILIAVTRQVNGLIAEREAMREQIAGLVAERDALRAMLGAQSMLPSLGMMLDGGDDIRKVEDGRQ